MGGGEHAYLGLGEYNIYALIGDIIYRLYGYYVVWCARVYIAVTPLSISGLEDENKTGRKKYINTAVGTSRVKDNRSLSHSVTMPVGGCLRDNAYCAYYNNIYIHTHTP